MTNKENKLKNTKYRWDSTVNIKEKEENNGHRIAEQKSCKT
jgi:hypothetical protein